MTYYERITSFNIDELAEFITGLCEERDYHCLEKLYEMGIDASIVHSPFELRVEKNKRLLLSEYSNSS